MDQRARTGRTIMANRTVSVPVKAGGEISFEVDEILS